MHNDILLQYSCVPVAIQTSFHACFVNYTVELLHLLPPRGPEWNFTVFVQRTSAMIHHIVQCWPNARLQLTIAKYST
jgi:hypothetical protein